MRYSCIGEIRGSCGHSHLTLRTAAKCILHDARGCARQGGYSDRRVRHADGTRLFDDEVRDLYETQRAMMRGYE